VGSLLGEQGLIFDIFGDTVNTASRITSSGVAGAIRVSEAVANQVSGIDTLPFALLPADPISAKGKGMLTVFTAHLLESDEARLQRGSKPDVTGSPTSPAHFQLHPFAADSSH